MCKFLGFLVKIFLRKRALNHIFKAFQRFLNIENFMNF